MADYYAGLMSGTSMDALDAVLVDFSTASPRLLASISLPIEPSLHKRLIELTYPGPNELERLAQADLLFGRFSAEALQQLLADTGVAPQQVMAVGSHGQTVRHAPWDELPYTMQIGDGNTIAQHSGITTVTDFRRRDMAAGGQGAPLVPAFHNAIYRSDTTSRVALNLGGIANITILPANPDAPVTGFDTGPANGLMDAWCQHYLNRPYDEDGRLAATGTVSQALLERLEDDAYFRLPPPKSTGREHFNLDWLRARLPETGANDVDILATLAELTVSTVAAAITEHAADTREVIVCGGGAYNRHLMQRLESHLPGVRICSSATYGIEPRWVEAIAFAWLARQTLRQLPGNLPAVTGANASVILGAIHPA